MADIVLKPYQQKAVYDPADGLLPNTLRYLASDKKQRLIVLKSIMGSGKTVIASEFIEALLESNAPERATKNLCIVWLSKGNAGLYIQSSDKIRGYIKPRDINVQGIKDSTDFNADRFNDKDVYVLNWEKLNNLKDGELVNNLFINSESRNIRRAISNSHDIDYILIIDEFHMNYGTPSYKKIIETFNPHVIVGMSATPTEKQMAIADTKCVIPVADVMREGMIKKSICFNTASDYSAEQISQYKTVDEFFLRLAIRQRDVLEEHFRNAGSDVIPLLLIQFNDDPSNADIIKVKDILDEMYENNKHGTYAVWISERDNKKANLRSSDDIIRNLQNSDVRILLFKQAVAVGWDCPRAQVLLRYRRVVTRKDADAVSTFDVQTIGRIFRMPEPDRFASKAEKHYDDELLNYGYVFVPNNSYALEKGFDDYLTDEGTIGSSITIVDYGHRKTPAEAPITQPLPGTESDVSVSAEIPIPAAPIVTPVTDDTQPMPVLQNEAAGADAAVDMPCNDRQKDSQDMSSKTAESDVSVPVSDQCDPEFPMPKPLPPISVAPARAKEQSELYAEQFGETIQQAEKILSKVNVQAVNQKPDQKSVHRMIKNILSSDFTDRIHSTDGDTTGQIVFEGKDLAIDDGLLEDGEKVNISSNNTQFSVDENPSVLEEKANKLLSDLIDGKQYSAETKDTLKRSIRRVFKQEAAGCASTDPDSVTKTNRLILCNEALIKVIIRALDDEIREQSTYVFEPADFHFPTIFTAPPKAEAESKALMHFPLPARASSPEKIFAGILDGCKNVLLWYKNKDHGSEAFCVSYSIRQEMRGRSRMIQVPTYPDFIVLFTDGSIGIYETKDLDKQDLKDAPKDAAISSVVAGLSRDNPVRKFYGGVLYINQEAQAVDNIDAHAELK